MSATPKADTDPILDLLPEEAIKKLEFGRQEEILQPLYDLAYIQKADASLLAEGIRLFRVEYLQLNLIPEFAPKLLSLPETELEGEELNLLHMLVALDGDFSLETLPESEQINLFSRIILYRLSIHQLYDGPVNAPFSKQQLQGLEQLREWIKQLPSEPIGIINLLGNIPALIHHINENNNGELHKRVVAFRYYKPRKVSSFQVPLSAAAKEEVEEDETDQGADNESQMLKLETEVDDEIDALQQAAVFDQEEQAFLEKDSRKHRRKRSRLIRVGNMIESVSAALQQISAAINLESDAISEDLNRLQLIVGDLISKEQGLANKIAEKDQAINQLKNSKKGLKRKKRRLKRKKRKGAPQQEIDQLAAEIRKINQADRKIEQLEIEKSDLNIQAIPIREDIKEINRRLKSLNRKMQKLIEERNERIREKQVELKKLLKKLKRLKAKVDRLRFSFRSRLKDVLDDDFYKKEISTELFQKRNPAILKTFSGSKYNQYLIRLIQIFQWTNGFYYGKLDNEIGDRTFNALDDMSTYSRGLRLKFILSKLSENHAGTKGYWILNIKYLFQKLCIILQEQPATSTQSLLKAYAEKFSDGTDEDAALGNEITDKGYEDMVAENQADLREDGAIRRIYYGVKRLVTTLFDALSDLIRIIKKGIQELIYLIKNLVKVIYKEIREGVRKFRDGLRFLFGRRQFETSTASGAPILTKFDFDFDALIISPRHLNKIEATQHIQQIERYANNLDFTMVLTGRVLKWAFALIDIGTPIGWAKLAIKVAIYYKDLIIEWFKDLWKKLRSSR